MQWCSGKYYIFFFCKIKTPPCRFGSRDGIFCRSIMVFPGTVHKMLELSVAPVGDSMALSGSTVGQLSCGFFQNFRESPVGESFLGIGTIEPFLFAFYFTYHRNRQNWTHHKNTCNSFCCDDPSLDAYFNSVCSLVLYVSSETGQKFSLGSPLNGIF